jgi:hypothetical protein
MNERSCLQKQKIVDVDNLQFLFCSFFSISTYFFVCSTVCVITAVGGE